MVELDHVGQLVDGGDLLPVVEVRARPKVGVKCFVRLPLPYVVGRARRRPIRARSARDRLQRILRNRV